ncbi:hypothetical protein TanjilG_25879 [Lupinus angustifolius]|uniref:Uncharacterized protein n=1 Tax=Lupinus angustifolius TaxID=3871 RepID=A0A1J7G2X0_LUPAN|nr:hypothetical protein TanjilG_25879 [Lupinus angustifolius]
MRITVINQSRILSSKTIIMLLRVSEKRERRRGNEVKGLTEWKKLDMSRSEAERGRGWGGGERVGKAGGLRLS